MTQNPASQANYGGQYEHSGSSYDGMGFDLAMLFARLEFLMDNDIGSHSLGNPHLDGGMPDPKVYSNCSQAPSNERVSDSSNAAHGHGYQNYGQGSLSAEGGNSATNLANSAANHGYANYQQGPPRENGPGTAANTALSSASDNKYQMNNQEASRNGGEASDAANGVNGIDRTHKQGTARTISETNDVLPQSSANAPKHQTAPQGPLRHALDERFTAPSQPNVPLPRGNTQSVGAHNPASQQGGAAQTASLQTPSQNGQGSGRTLYQYISVLSQEVRRSKAQNDELQKELKQCRKDFEETRRYWEQDIQAKETAIRTFCRVAYDFLWAKAEQKPNLNPSDHSRFGVIGQVASGIWPGELHERATADK